VVHGAGKAAVLSATTSALVPVSTLIMTLAIRAATSSASAAPPASTAPALPAKALLRAIAG
jgi:hypothetical protein